MLAPAALTQRPVESLEARPCSSRLSMTWASNPSGVATCSLPSSAKPTAGRPHRCHMGLTLDALAGVGAQRPTGILAGQDRRGEEVAIEDAANHSDSSCR